MVIPNVCLVVGAGGSSQTHTSPFLMAASLTRKPDLSNSQAIAEASALLGAVKHSPHCF